MSAGPAAGRSGVVVVGDALVDVVEQADGTTMRHPGGAGLNVAVGVARLGLRALHAYPAADDEPGRWLAAAVEAEGIELVRLPAGPESGIAHSRRVDGEPVYEFSAPVLNRSYTYPAGVLARLSTARVMAVSSFPMGDLAQVAALVAVAREAGLDLAVDPNVRPTLLAADDRAGLDYRAGFLAVAAASVLVKISCQDLDLLFGPDHDAAIGQLLAAGPQAVVVTAGAEGAVVHARAACTDGLHMDGEVVRVPIAAMDGPVVDTMGAGDVVLARLAVELATAGMPRTPQRWRTVLDDAMNLAAAVCRVAGGLLPAPLTHDQREEHDHGAS